MRSEPSGSLKDTRRSAPLRATSADKVGMPIVLSPPSVSADSVNVARYFSGSRAAMLAVSTGALALTLVGAVLVFATAFALAFALVLLAGWQAAPNTPSTIAAKRKKSVDSFDP